MAVFLAYGDAEDAKDLFGGGVAELDSELVGDGEVGRQVTPPRVTGAAMNFRSGSTPK